MEFGFMNLEVWQKAVDLADKVIDMIESLKTNRKHYRLIEDLEAAAVSVASNIAEGKGRYSKKEFIRFLYISRGSLYETVTFLKIFNRKNWIKEARYEELLSEAEEVVRMLVGLIKSVRRDS